MLIRQYIILIKNKILPYPPPTPAKASFKIASICFCFSARSSFDKPPNVAFKLSKNCFNSGGKLSSIFIISTGFCIGIKGADCGFLVAGIDDVAGVGADFAAIIVLYSAMSLSIHLIRLLMKQKIGLALVKEH